MTTAILSTYRLYRDAYSGHPREVWTLAFVTFINRMGTMVLPFLAVYLNTQLGFTLKEAGVLISAFGFGSLIGSWGGGKLADRISPKVLIFISLILSGGLLFSLQFVTGFLPLWILIFSTALLGEAYRPAMMVLLGRVVPKNQMGRTMSMIRLAINLGFSAAPGLGGFMAATAGYKWLFWVDGITCVLAGLAFMILSRNWESGIAKQTREEEKAAKSSSKPVHRNIPYLIFLVATFLMGFGFIQMFHTAPVFIKTDWGFDERVIGIMMGGGSLLISLIEMPLIHHLEKTGRMAFSLILGVWLIGVAYLFFLLPGSIALCFAMAFVWTMGEILHLPFNTTVGINMSPDARRGEYMGWYWMAWSLTNILGPVTGLFLADKFGFTATWLFVAVVVAIAFVLNLSLLSKMRDV